MGYLFAILFVCYGCYAYNRKSVSHAMPSLIAEGLDTSHAGLIISCQNLAFTVSKFLAGVLSDRINPQLLFASGLLISGAATIFFSSSVSLTAFCGLWFLNGLAQGCGWPACAKILRQESPPSQFGTLWSVLSSSYNVVGSLSPFLSAFIILNFGWRTSVVAAGLASVLLGIFLFCLQMTNSSLYSSSQTKIKEPETRSKNVESTIYDLLSDPFVWLIFTAYMLVFCAKTTTVDWGRMYLMKEINLKPYAVSAFVSSVESGGFFGRIAAGYLTDLVIRRKIRLTNSPAEFHKVNLRLSVGVLFMLGSLLFIHLFQYSVTEASSTLRLILIGLCMGICYYGPIAIFGIVSAESAPTYLSGSSTAIASAGANIGAVISGLPFSYIAKYYSWSTVFFILEITTAVITFTLFTFRNLKPKLIHREKYKPL